MCQRMTPVEPVIVSVVCVNLEGTATGWTVLKGVVHKLLLIGSSTYSIEIGCLLTGCFNF